MSDPRCTLCQCPAGEDAAFAAGYALGWRRRLAVDKAAARRAEGA